MQIIHLALLRTSSPGDAVVLSQCSDLAQFGFFERPTVRQMLQFFAKTVCGRVSPGQRVSVDQEEMEGYRVHAHVRADGLAATATCDAEYPARAAFSLLAQPILRGDADVLRALLAAGVAPHHREAKTERSLLHCAIDARGCSSPPEYALALSLRSLGREPSPRSPQKVRPAPVKSRPERKFQVRCGG